MFIKPIIQLSSFWSTTVQLNQIKSSSNDTITLVSDGYILTSNNWPTIFKYKPIEHLTIDLFCANTMYGLKLLVSVGKNQEVYYELPSFNQDIIVCSDVRLCLFSPPLNKHLSNAAPDLFESFVGTIVECWYDPIKHRMVPVWKWTDWKFPNNLKIAYDNFNAIINPLQFDDIFGNLINTYFWSNDSAYDSLKKYHNRVKWIIYEQYLGEYQTVCDIGIGVGQDLSKYIQHKTKLLIGVEPNMDSMIELLHWSHYSLNIELINTSFDELDPQLLPIVDVYVFSFSLHYCLDLTSTMIKLSSWLKPNGLIIIFYVDTSDLKLLDKIN